MFITFEGIDGSGKTTQALLLQEYLIKNKKQVVLTKETGGTDFGVDVRNLIFQYFGKILNSSILLCVMGARNEHLDKLIMPSLKSGKVVICDRFIDSTACYQAFDAPAEEIKGKMSHIYDLHKSFFNIWPDITFYIDTNIDRTIENLEQRKNFNAFDLISKDKKQLLIDCYDFVAGIYKERIVRINGNQSIEDVHKEIISHLNF